MSISDALKGSILALKQTLTLYGRFQIKFLVFASITQLLNNAKSHSANRFLLSLPFRFAHTDVVNIERTGENFRILYDVKGRFILHKITSEEASYKLCRVKRAAIGPNKIPYIITHDGRTIRYPDPLIKANDTIKYDISTNKIIDFTKFEVGQLCLVTGGHSMGRIGTIISRERHPGSFEIIHVKDAVGNTFATRLSNIFVIGSQKAPLISLPANKGVRLSAMEERTRRLAKRK